jgi:hypothetical protein
MVDRAYEETDSRRNASDSFPELANILAYKFEDALFIMRGMRGIM